MFTKIKLRIVTKNHVADQETGFLTKSISKPSDRATAMPPAWELKFDNFWRVSPFPDGTDTGNISPSAA